MKINKCVSKRNWCFKPQNIFSICWLTLVFEEIRTFFLLHKKENLKSICMNKHGILVNRAIAHSVMYGHSFSPLKRCNVKASQIIRRLHFTYCIILNTITSFIRMVKRKVLYFNHSLSLDVMELLYSRILQKRNAIEIPVPTANRLHITWIYMTTIYVKLWHHFLHFVKALIS